MRHDKSCKCYHCDPYEALKPEHLPKGKWPEFLGGGSMHPKDCDCAYCISPERLREMIESI